MRLHPVGFSHLGQVNADGIRYVWQLRDNAPYIESAAFRARAKIPTSDADSHISAYTTSVSGGCALTAAKVPCRFCRTGNTLRFSGHLSAKEIALQNVFMVLSDMEQTGQAAATGTADRTMAETAHQGSSREFRPRHRRAEAGQRRNIRDKSGQIAACAPLWLDCRTC